MAVRYNRSLIRLASGYHIIWGLLLTTNGGVPLPFTASFFLARFMRNPVICGLALVAVGVLALAGIHVAPAQYWRLRLLSFLPQLVFLLFSTASVLLAVFLRHFGDGVPRPWRFIAGDQLLVLLITAFYTLALIEPAFPHRHRIEVI